MEVTIRFKSRTLAFLLRRWARPVSARRSSPAPAVAPEVITTPLRRVAIAATPVPVPEFSDPPAPDSRAAKHMPAPIPPEPAASRLITLRLNNPPEPIAAKPVVVKPMLGPLRPDMPGTTAVPKVSAAAAAPPPREILAVRDEEQIRGWFPSFANASPATIWVTGLVMTLVLGATAMVATMESVPNPLKTLGHVSGAIRDNMAQPAEPEAPRPPQAAFPFAADPATKDNVPRPVPRILGLRTDACLSQVPDPAEDPWNARFSSAASAGGDAGRLIAPTRAPGGCFATSPPEY